jgi:hypothetical protein
MTAATSRGDIFDPFPNPRHQAGSPTGVIDWDAIATKIVRDVLRLERHERVILCADPYFGGAALDALRVAVLQAQAVELATILHWTERTSALRQRNGNARDAADQAAELAAMRHLFAGADVFILLMNDRRSGRRTVSGGQAEAVIDDWPGRAVHLHWFHDPAIPDPSHPVNLALDRMNERATLALDYASLATTMRAISTRMRGSTVRLTAPNGTDLTFRVGSRVHENCGQASREQMAHATSGRDREEELPAGSWRTMPVPDTAEGVLVFPITPGGESPALARGMDASPFIAAGLRFHFHGGRVAGVETGGDQAALDALWAAETGDKDALGELVLGCNPLLVPVPGSHFQPHYGFGGGVVRLILGDNSLSGGIHRSSFHRWAMFSDASIAADGVPIVEGGRLITLRE